MWAVKWSQGSWKAVLVSCARKLLTQAVFSSIYHTAILNFTVPQCRQGDLQTWIPLSCFNSISVLTFIDPKDSISLEMIKGCKCSNRWMASLMNKRTSVAASSLLSDRNSRRTGITVAAMSGNLMQQECSVRTNNCRYFPVSSCSTTLCVFETSFRRTSAISSIFLDDTSSIAKRKIGISETT